MHPTNCLNCSALLTADDRFCPACGQKSDTHRLSMSHIWHDLVHAFTHADKGFLHTLKELAVRPGTVAREYVQGKRKKYFNPFSFLIIIVGVYLVSNSIFEPFSRPADMVTRKPPPSFQNESKRKLYSEIGARSRKFGQFMNKRTNIVLFVSTPFIAMVLWLLFKRSNFNYAEHLSTMAYVNGFLSVLSILIFGPLIYLSKGTSFYQPIYYGMLVTHVLYVGFMYHGFMGYTRRIDYFKTMGAGLVGIAAWGLLSMGVGMYYIRYGF